MTEQNKAIIREFVAELTNKHNSGAWERYCAAHFTHHFHIPYVPNNLAGAKHLSEQILAAFPDVSTKVNLLIAEGDWIVEQASATATHLGDFMGISPTQKRVNWEETHCYRLENGKIAEHYPNIHFGKIMFELLGKNEKIYKPKPSFLSSLIAKGIGAMYFVMPSIKLNQSDKVERNREVVRAYIERFKNQQEFLTFPQLYQPKKFIHHFNFEGQHNSLSSFVSVGQEFLSAFPDVKVKIIKLLAEGDYVVELNTVNATHKGTYFNIPATNRIVNWSETHIYRLENERIVENIPSVNFEEIIQQIS